VSEGDEDYPTVKCPKCGTEQSDMDGFGFIACFTHGCMYCTHPNRDLTDDGWKCGICGDVTPNDTAARPMTTADVSRIFAPLPPDEAAALREYGVDDSTDDGEVAK
jgi:hypothetical protein